MKTKRIIALILLASMILIPTQVIGADTFTEEQQKRADVIAEICMDNWDEYGVLPSVAIAQAFVESTLGEHCNNYNLWGIESGARAYGSLEEGTYDYLKVINNGYYDNAPFCKDYSEQIYWILEGGYCQPVGNYYENAIWTIEHYNLAEYDKKMFAEIKEKKRLEKQKKTFTIVHDSTIPENVAVVNEKIIKSGAICIYLDKKLEGIYDVKEGGAKREIRINKQELDGKKVKIKVYEKARG